MSSTFADEELRMRKFWKLREEFGVTFCCAIFGRAEYRSPHALQILKSPQTMPQQSLGVFYAVCGRVAAVAMHHAL